MSIDCKRFRVKEGEKVIAAEMADAREAFLQIQDAEKVARFEREARR